MSDRLSELSVERSTLSVEGSGSTAAVDPENPWVGLASFTEESRAYFHGRDEEVGELARRVQRKLLTILFGQSGLGKTSILRAGVVPRLRNEGYCPVYVRIDYGPTAPRPSEQVKRAVLRATADAGTWTVGGALRPDLAGKSEASGHKAPPTAHEETLWEFLHHRDDVLRDPSGRTLIPLIVFDQFEEIFTLGQSDEAGRERATEFKEELADLVENRAPKALEDKLEQDETIIDRYDFARSDYRILISLREDYLPHLDTLKGRMPSITQNRMRLARMTGTQALEAVVKPGGALVTPEVARAIVEFVAGARGGSIERLAEIDVEPPLLSVICRELNDRRRALGQPQITAEMVTGNRREILTDFYERSVADLPEPMRRFVEDKLLTKSGFRDNLALETALEEPGVTKELIDTLVSRRLLRLEDRLGTQRVELTHDVLADVVRASRDARQQRMLLEEAERRQAQERLQGRRREQRHRLLIVALGLVVVGLSIGAIFGIHAQRIAADKVVRSDLAAATRLLEDGKVGDGLAYLVSAARRETDTSVAATRILTTLTGHNFLLPVGGPLQLPCAVRDIQLLHGRSTALVLGDDGRLRLLDVAGWKVVREYQFSENVQPRGLRTAARNPALFAVALVNGTVAICDTDSDRPRLPPITPPQRVAALAARRNTAEPWTANIALSPDGKWLRLVNESWSLFDTTTGKEVSGGDTYHHRRFIDPANAPFSPDSRTVVTSTSTISVSATGALSTTGSAVELRSVPDGAGTATFPLDEVVTSGVGQGVMFSADGKRLLVVSYLANRTGAVAAFVRDTATLARVGPPVPVPNATQRATQAWLTPDGTQIVVSLEDRNITVYDVATGKPSFPPLRHNGPATCVGMSENGAVLATVSLDGLTRLWDLKTGALAAEATFRQDRPGAAALTPDGRTLLMSDAKGVLRRLQVTQGPAVPLVLPRPAGAFMAQFVEHRPGRLWWFEARGARELDIAAGRWTDGGFSYPFPVTPGGLTGSVDSMVGSFLEAMRPGDTVIARADRDAAPRIWTLDAKGVGRDVPFADPLPAGTIFLRSPGGKVVAAPFTALGQPAGIGIWSMQTGARVGLLPGVDTSAWATTLAANRNTTGFSDDDGRLVVQVAGAIRVYDVAQGRLLFELRAEERAPFRVARFSADGRRLYTGNAWGVVQVWDGFTGKLRQSRQAHGFAAIRFDMSGGGKYYASLSQDGSTQVWDGATDEPVGDPLMLGASVMRASFSQDESRISIGATDGVARTWDVRSGVPLQDPMDHGGGNVPQALPSGDGRYILTYSGYLAGNPHNRIWAAPPPPRPGRAPKWLLRLATVCAGRQVTEEGKVVPAIAEFDRFDDLRREINETIPNDLYAEWAHWFLSDSPRRSIAPGFSVTPADAKALAYELSAPDRLNAMMDRDLEMLLKRQYPEMEAPEREILRLSIQRDGEGSAGHASALWRLAATLVMIGKAKEAEMIARECQAIREKQYPSEPNHPLLVNVRSLIGSALVEQKRYAEAEPLLAPACETLVKSSLPDGSGTKVHIPNRVATLVRLFEDTGRAEQAAGWRKRLEAFVRQAPAPAAPVQPKKQKAAKSPAASTPSP